MTPEAAMRLALAQARRAAGRTFPNPAVGAVVFRGDRVLGRGATRPPGGAHAEVVAIENALRRAGVRAVRGASMAVTLEPCCHVGRTLPCTDAILEARLGRLFVGSRDPHPAVAGRGMARLRRGGVRVASGVLGEACREHHRGFLSVQERGRPFVTLKLAATLDGRIATARGDSRWITGTAARAFVHRLRSRVDSVMVGSGTALADDPLLTARRGRATLHRPIPILVDSKLRVPPSARLFGPRSAPRGAIVLAAGDAPARRRAALERVGARVVTVRRRRGRIDLARGLELVAAAGPTTVLVEGGGGLAAALLRPGLVDELHWLVAPKLLGGDGRPALDALGVETVGNAVTLGTPTVRRLGDDLHVHARFPGSRKETR